MLKVLLIISSLSVLGLPSLSYSNERNDTILLSCGYMRYIPLHDSMKIEKVYRESKDVSKDKVITITVIINCEGRIVDAYHVDYHE